MQIQRLLAAASAATCLFVAPAANAAIVDFTTLILNGSATATPSVLTLTEGANLADPDDVGSNIGYQASAFLGTAFSTIDGFSTSFTFSLTNTGFDPLADGISFIIQNDPNGTAALGGGGAGIGADGISNSAGVAFQSWDNNHATIFTNGNVSGGLPLGNFDLGQQDDVVNVTVDYAARRLSFTATNLSTGQIVSQSRYLNLETLGSEAYIGFTGATGLSHSLQEISNWEFSVQDGAGTAVPEPGAWALMIGGFGLAGATLRRRRALAA